MIVQHPGNEKAAEARIEAIFRRRDQANAAAAKLDESERAALNELHIRANALGYKTIHTSGETYWLVDADDEGCAYGIGLANMARILTKYEENGWRCDGT